MDEIEFIKDPKSIESLGGAAVSLLAQMYSEQEIGEVIERMSKQLPEKCTIMAAILFGLAVAGNAADQALRKKHQLN